MSDAVSVRPGFHTVTPYFIVNGAQQLIEFLSAAFGGELQSRHMRPEDEKKIMHAEVRIGDSIVELADATETFGAFKMGMHLFVPDADAVFQRAIAAGGTELYPIRNAPYGERTGGVTDPWGNQWYIATPL